MRLDYCEKWFRAKKCSVSPLIVEDAKNRHANGLPYAVAISPSDKVEYVVEVVRDWVSVMFMDDRLRPYLSYDFKKEENSRLFLSKAIHIEYLDDSDKIASSVTFVFKEDGNIFIERRDHSKGTIEQKESFGDPSINWDDFPVFGEYGRICRIERSGA